MANHIIKGNSALTLFSVQSANIDDKVKELFAWRNLINMFHYDADAICNLIFVNHPLETFVGLSVRCDEGLLEQKALRYAEGMAFLLTSRFWHANVDVLTQEEALAVVCNLSALNGIPADLRNEGSHKLDGANDTLRLLFARVLNPQMVLEKANEFCRKDSLRSLGTLESRIGVRAAWDERMLYALPNPFLAYSFVYHASEEARDVAVATSETSVSRPIDFVQEFLNEMGVPDSYLYRIQKAKVAAEILETPDVCLVPPKTVAEYVLGYR